MKRKLQLGVLVMVLGLALTGCCMSHEWNVANCTFAKTCIKCGETEGEALGHVWVAATCTEAKTCSTCGETEGVALGHAWTDATCTEAKVCSTCKETEGVALGHDWKEATLNEPKTCEGCGITEGVTNKEAVTEAAEVFLKAVDDVDKETVADMCMGFVLVDMGMAQLSTTAIEKAFYQAVGIEKEWLSIDAQNAVIAYGDTCAEVMLQGYSVKDVTGSDGVYTVTATIHTFSPKAENPMESEELMTDVEALEEDYVENNMDALLEVYLLKGEEAMTMQMYNDLIPEILSLCEQAIHVIELEDVEIVFHMEKLGERWVVTEISEFDGSENPTL